MRRLVYLILVLVFLVAACQPTESPTAGPDAGGTTAIIVDATSGPTAEPRQREVVPGETLPPAGVILPDVTADASIGEPFTYILFARTGGPNGNLNLEILNDGTITRDGVTGTLQPQQVQQLNDVLVQIGFFSIQGIFLAPGATADTLKYSITVERANGDMVMIQAQEGLIPAPLQTLITLLEGMGQPPQ